MPRHRIIDKILLAPFIANDDIPLTASSAAERFSNANNVFCLRLMIFGLAILILFFLLLTAGLFNKQNTVFNVVAKTESVKIISGSDSPFPSWLINGADIYDEWKLTLDGNGIIATNTDVELQISHNTAIEVTRTLNAVPTIFLSSNEEQSVGFITDMESGERVQLPPRASIILENYSDQIRAGQPIVLPGSGDFQIGGAVNWGLSNIPLLQSGTVTFLDRELLFGEPYSVGPFPLDLGDQFRIAKQSSPSQGFIRIGQDPGIEVVYRGEGESGVIERYQTAPVALENTIWSRISNDRTLVLIWFLAICFYLIIKTIIRYSLEVSNTIEMD